MREPEQDKVETYFFIATFPMQTVVIEVEADDREKAERKARLSSLTSGAEFCGPAMETIGRWKGESPG